MTIRQVVFGGMGSADLDRLDEQAYQLRRVQEELSDRWSPLTELTPDQLVRAWIATVAIIEVGYEGAWEEYTHDLSTREYIGELSRRLPESWGALFAEWVAPWDERFRAATVEQSEPILRRPEDSPSWWWYRTPRIWPGKRL